MNDNTLSRLSGRKRLLSASLAAVVAGIAIWAATVRIAEKPHTITVDDTPIATLESRKAVKTVINLVRTRQSEELPAVAVRFAEQVRFRPALEGEQLADMAEAVGALEKAATVQAEFYCVVANTDPVVALPNREDAEKVLELVKQHYEGKTGRKHSESSFKESVYVDRAYASPRVYRTTPEQAVDVLTSVTEEPIYHTIQRGDRAANLAMQYGISLPELKKLNPEMNPDRIVEGDRLLIRTPKAPVTVVSKSMVKRTENVAPPQQAGRSAAGRVGKREMQVLVTYENGIPVAEQVISQVTTWGKR